MFLFSFFSLNQIQLLFVVSWQRSLSEDILLAVSRQWVFPFDVSCPSSQFEFLIVSQLHVTTTPISATTVYCLSRGQSCARVYACRCCLNATKKRKKQRKTNKHKVRQPASDKGDRREWNTRGKRENREWNLAETNRTVPDVAPLG